MREVTIRSPGSCGEFIQGIYGGEPCLVSCPIDMYASLTVREGPPRAFLPGKASLMYERIFEEYAIPRGEKHHIDVALRSDIPLEKGMASSTADIAAVALGLSAYFDLGMDDRRIAELCIAIEPTDNLMFPRLNLFNHVDGDVLMDFGESLEASILIVDFAGRINTVGFHGQREGYGSEDQRRFARVVRHFREGVAAGDLDWVGGACTESARLNQKILYKPHLETLIDLCQSNGGHGIVTGHSGTVIGVLYSKERFDYKGFMTAFINAVPPKDYEAIYLRRVIPGGLSIDQSKRKQEEL